MVAMPSEEQVAPIVEIEGVVGVGNIGDTENEPLAEEEQFEFDVVTV